MSLKNYFNQNKEVLKFLRVALFYTTHILILKYFFSLGVSDPEGDAVTLLLSNIILIFTIFPMLIITYEYETVKSWRRAHLVASLLIPTLWLILTLQGGNPLVGL